jgi:hypothetical protein
MRKLERKEATKMGKKGGRRRAQSLTPERRKEISANAVAARWKKWRDNHAAGQGPSKDPD